MLSLSQPNELAGKTSFPERAEELGGADPYLTPELLEEFKQLYRREFGVLLSDEEALSRAITFLRLFEAVYRPIPSTQHPSCQESEGGYNERKPNAA